MGFRKTFFEDILTQEEWAKHPHLVFKIMESSNKYDELILKHLLTKDFWVLPEIIKAYFKNNPTYRNPGSSTLLKRSFYSTLTSKDRILAEQVMSRKIWTAHPEILIELIQRGLADRKIEQHVFSKEYWINHPVLQRFTNKKQVTFKDLKRQLGRISFNLWYQEQQRIDAQKQTPLTCSKVLN